MISLWSSVRDRAGGEPNGRVFISLLLLGLGTSAGAQPVAFPDDSGVVNVTNWSSDPALLAIPDDGIDDTAAIQAALDAFRGTKAIVYLPDGVYDLSDSLVYKPAGPGALAVRTVMQGQSRDGVVLKLNDNLTRSDGSAFDGAILTMGGGSADYFQNVVRNLTFNTGSGNASASGLEFNASNQGTARDLRIVSGDGAGHIGLDLGYADNIGPLLVKDVVVEGFDTGIRSQSQANSKVFEDVVVRNQNVAGLENSSTSTIQVRNFRSENDVPAITNSFPIGNTDPGNPGNGRLILIDAELVGAGGASLTSPAIINANGNSAPKLYARNVQIENYDLAVSSPQQTAQGNRSIRTDFIEEYWHNGTAGNSNKGGAFQLFDNTPDTGLGLAVRETPDSPIDN
ncbi:MAG: glycosyl hydrolase family 28-related protein, partial [Planctomycetota bacterium]